MRIKQDHLRPQAWNTENVTEEALDATKEMVSVVGREVTIFKNGYLELLSVLSSKT